MRKLLLQRAKVDQNVLENYLSPAVVKQWQEILSSLEDKNRKLINIQSGSLIFLLFCPTRMSILQLQDESWRIEIQNKMAKLLKLLGTEVIVKLQMRESEERQYTQDLRKVRSAMRSQKVKIVESEKRSIGYETMTTVSDLDSELLESAAKVEGWLYQQDTSDTTKSNGKDQTIQLVKTWSLNHIELRAGKVNRSNRFTMSESGAVGISCNGNPSLSVMYPNTDKAPVILSNDMIYRSATFLKLRGKEQLAAACLEDGCLYLWDIESKNCRKVFDPKFSKDKRLKSMNICKIDDNTFGYGEVYASLDGSRNVFILKKKDTTEDWALSATLKLFTPDNVWDMCHTKMSDGRPYLLLCIPHGNCIMAVEMVGGKIIWEVGQQDMGENFQPWSICTDENNYVYVADFGQRKIHLLSAADGTVKKRLLWCYGIRNIFAGRFYDQHLYVEHRVNDGNVQEYAILKFKTI